MKVLDWSKMPSGVPVHILGGAQKMLGHFLRANAHGGCVVEISQSSHGQRRYFHSTDCELREQEQFTYWPGDECPLPDGVMVEVVFRYGGKAAREPSSLSWRCNYEEDDIIAYRILDIAPGWKYPHEVENET